MRNIFCKTKNNVNSNTTEVKNSQWFGYSQCITQFYSTNVTNVVVWKKPKTRMVEWKTMKRDNTEEYKLLRISEHSVALTRKESHNGWIPLEVKLLSVGSMRRNEEKRCFAGQKGQNYSGQDKSDLCLFSKLQTTEGYQDCLFRSLPQ